jgi:hypothetical protein
MKDNTDRTFSKRKVAIVSSLVADIVYRRFLRDRWDQMTSAALFDASKVFEKYCLMLMARPAQPFYRRRFALFSLVGVFPSFAPPTRRKDHKHSRLRTCKEPHYGLSGYYGLWPQVEAHGHLPRPAPRSDRDKGVRGDSPKCRSSVAVLPAFSMVG